MKNTRPYCFEITLDQMCVKAFKCFKLSTPPFEISRQKGATFNKNESINRKSVAYRPKHVHGL